MYNVLIIIQYIIISIISVIILQIIFLHEYSTSLIILATIVSYVPASVILGILSYRFLAWFKTRRNSITLLFFIGSGMVAVNLAVGMVIHSYYIESVKPDIITEQSQIPTAYPKITPQSVGILSPLYLTHSLFLLIWRICLHGEDAPYSYITIPTFWER
jgi:hypothetical protein